MITTSNGLIPLPWTYEVTDPLDFGSVDTAEDECIISYVELNAQNARHISVNSGNDVWVGGSKNNNTFDLVDGETGAILKTFDVGVGGYGGLIDCNDVLWSVGLFRYDTNQDITASICCEPDILVDSNNDGVIDEDDNQVEITSALEFEVNSDDDNGDLVPDFENIGPVFGEDDLQEIQLFVSCDVVDPAAWWSLSWNGVECGSNPATETIRIWRHPDKSDGDETNPGPGEPIDNACPYYGEWPPPDRVWLEAREAYNDIEITFTINYDESREQKSNKVKTRGPCTPSPLGPGGRWYIAAAQQLPPGSSDQVTGIAANITTTLPLSLCGGTTGKVFTHSDVFLNITDLWPNTNPPRARQWVQFGYTTERSKSNSGGVVYKSGVYYESVWDAGLPSKDRDFDIDTTLTTTGSPRYTIYSVDEIQGEWIFNFRDSTGHFTEVFSFAHWRWAYNAGEFADFQSEIAHKENQVPGTVQSPCVFSDCVWAKNWGSATPTNFLAQQIRFFPPNPPAGQWGYSLLSPTSFQMWDEIPIQ